jgi:dTDP-4-amino-4,6-dideoxygalactose transaminase
MMESIHLFRPQYRVEEALAEIRECLEQGWTGAGAKTLEFEQAWRQYSGVAHAHFVNSCTAALHLALKLLKEDGRWADGDEIITTPFTFVSTNHVILYERLKPVFADIDEYLCLDPASVESRITKRTRAVCFVGIGGNMGRYREVRDLCRARGLALILDGAHMTGTWIGSEHAGVDADAAAFSFQAVKNLPTADAGMVCFAREDLDQEVRRWSWLGIDKDTYTRSVEQPATYRWRYDVPHVGFKYHGNAVMAALALVGLRHVEEDNQRRREIAGWYDEALRALSTVRGIPQPDGFRSSRHLYQVLVDRRDEVILGMNRRGIFPGMHYADNTCYPMYRYAHGTCPNAEHASEQILSLPMHLGLNCEHVQRIAEALKETTTELQALAQSARVPRS